MKRFMYEALLTCLGFFLIVPAFGAAPDAQIVGYQQVGGCGQDGDQCSPVENDAVLRLAGESVWDIQLCNSRYSVDQADSGSGFLRYPMRVWDKNGHFVDVDEGRYALQTTGFYQHVVSANVQAGSCIILLDKGGIELLRKVL